MWWMSLQRGGPVAAGEGAAAVAEDDGGAGGAGEWAAGAAEVDGYAGAVEDDGQDLRVAGEAAGGRG